MNFPAKKTRRVLGKRAKQLRRRNAVINGKSIAMPQGCDRVAVEHAEGSSRVSLVFYPVALKEA